MRLNDRPSTSFRMTTSKIKLANSFSTSYLWLVLLFYSATLQESFGLMIQKGDLINLKDKMQDFQELQNEDFTGANRLYLGYSGYPWNDPQAINNQNENPNTTYQKSPTLKSEDNQRQRRFKRGVVHLYNMVVCATGCNPLAYKGYGCYCGFLGSGFTTDGIDMYKNLCRCCKMHDWCYDATDCPMFLEYFVPYYWKCSNGYKPVCAIDHGKYGGSGSCAQRLCECDRSFAECLRRFPCPTTKAMCTSSPWRFIQNLFMVV